MFGGVNDPRYKRFSGKRFEKEDYSRSKMEMRKQGKKQKRWGWIDSYRVVRSQDDGRYWVLYVR